MVNDRTNVHNYKTNYFEGFLAGEIHKAVERDHDDTTIYFYDTRPMATGTQTCNILK